MSKVCENCFVFLGPSAYGLELTELDPAIRLLPPVRRGDVARLVAEEEPCSIAIIDGQFQQCLSVGHAEIRDAIEAGWSIWGLASMGAIRAYEMRNIGMRGFGKVYEQFLSHEDFRDDEVALLHAGFPPYWPVTEPLVNIRHGLNVLCRTGVLGKNQVETIVDQLAALWFGHRTLELTKAAILSQLDIGSSREVDHWISDFASCRIKTLDVKSFFEVSPWASTRLT